MSNTSYLDGHVAALFILKKETLQKMCKKKLFFVFKNQRTTACEGLTVYSIAFLFYLSYY